MDNRRQIEEEASNWVARRDGQHWKAEDEEALAHWLEASTAHTVAFLRLEATWQQANRLKALGAGLPAGAVPVPGDLQSSPYFDTPALTPASIGVLPTKPRFRQWMYGSVAAAVVVAAVFFTWNHGLLDRNRYSTPVGGLASVPMADGSKVILNTDSDVKLEVSDTERRVELQRGEAFFDVARDPKRPFVVSVGDTRVVAVGTQFSVQRGVEGIRVVVTEGSVRIEQSKPGQGPAPLLIAGNVARAGRADVQVQNRSLSEAEELLSWREGYVIFHETRLADAAAEFNRYNTRAIVVDDAAVADIRIGGKFRSTNIDSFIGLLRDGFPVLIEDSPERIVLRAARPRS